MLNRRRSSHGIDQFRLGKQGTADRIGLGYQLLEVTTPLLFQQAEYLGTGGGGYGRDNIELSYVVQGVPEVWSHQINMAWDNVCLRLEKLD